MRRRAPLLLLICFSFFLVRSGHARDIDDATRSRLEALGYVNEVEEEDAAAHPTGVTLHDRSRAQPGVNVYCSAERETVHFFDNDGTERHRIELDLPGKGPDCMIEPYGAGKVIGI